MDIKDGGFDMNIVALSAAVAVLASFSALSIAVKITKTPRTDGKTRALMLCGGGMVMGVGLWAAHMISLLAYEPYRALRFEAGAILFSIAICTLSSFIAFYLLQIKQGSGYGIAVGALTMGLGLTGMHFASLKAGGVPGYSGEGGTLRTGISVDMLAIYGITAALLLIFLISWLALVADRRMLEQMAYRDPLTGLSNRNEMNRYFDTYQNEGALGLLFLDLDHFKKVNDTLGHTVGDLLVQEVGLRLRQFVCSGQQVYRIGGDEFLFIVQPCSRERAERLAEDILSSIQRPFHFDDRECFVTASIGIRLGSPRESDRSILLRTADQAMYQAKKLGKNRYCVYEEPADHALSRDKQGKMA